MKEDYCDKCKQFTIVERHHILPKSTFGENKEVAKLCPTCHALFHQKLGTENLKNPDVAFQFYFFQSLAVWLTKHSSLDFSNLLDVRFIKRHTLF